MNKSCELLRGWYCTYHFQLRIWQKDLQVHYLPTCINLVSSFLQKRLTYCNFYFYTTGKVYINVNFSGFKQYKIFIWPLINYQLVYAITWRFWQTVRFSNYVTAKLNNLQPNRFIVILKHSEFGSVKCKRFMWVK